MSAHNQKASVPAPKIYPLLSVDHEKFGHMSIFFLQLKVTKRRNELLEFLNEDDSACEGLTTWSVVCSGDSTKKVLLESTSGKHLRTKVSPDFHLTYSKNGGNLGSESK